MDVMGPIYPSEARTPEMYHCSNLVHLTLHKHVRTVQLLGLARVACHHALIHTLEVPFATALPENRMKFHPLKPPAHWYLPSGLKTKKPEATAKQNSSSI